MSKLDFKDAAVVLVGHGSSVNDDSAATLQQHAAELRRRRMFAEVREAFWKQEPKLGSLRGFATARVFYVPMFMGEGYFSERLIPQALGFRPAAEKTDDFKRVKRVSAQWHYYCRPLGTHNSMTSVLLARAKGILQQFPFPRPPRLNDLTLFIAGHGTERDANSRKSLDRQVQLIRDASIFAAVHPAFIEEEPRISASYDVAQTPCFVVVPFFMSDGLHVREDIPVLLGEPEAVVQRQLQARQPTWRNPTERRGKLVWCSGSVGSEPLIAEVILERITEAAAWGPIQPQNQLAP